MKLTIGKFSVLGFLLMGLPFVSTAFIAQEVSQYPPDRILLVQAATSPFSVDRAGSNLMAPKVRLSDSQTLIAACNITQKKDVSSAFILIPFTTLMNNPACRGKVLEAICQGRGGPKPNVQPKNSADWWEKCNNEGACCKKPS